MEYKPNTLFAFIKNDRSFHGVEPIGDQAVLRDILLYDIRVNPPSPDGENETPQEQGQAPGGLLKRFFGGGRA
jgi:hypothetical protein